MNDDLELAREFAAKLGPNSSTAKALAEYEQRIAAGRPTHIFLDMQSAKWWIVSPGEERPRQLTTPEAAYHDPTFPPRECDHCGVTYQGPALYCSLKCAIADA